MTIRIDPHTRSRMPARGISEDEIVEVLRGGVPAPASFGRLSKEKVFRFDSMWQGRSYSQKKVKVVYVEDDDAMVTVTAYAYYGSWREET